MLVNLLNTFSTAELICLAVLFFSLLVQLYFYLRFYTAVFRHKRRIKKGKIKLMETLPEVSVIICARNEEENLKKHLPSILKQDYPNYEVIVINDRSYDETETVLEQFKKDYPHLKTSFVPHDAKYIDSKKIAVILGVKAAKNDILVFTDADCEAVSDKWLENMVRSFSGDTQIVLGYGAYNKNKSFTNFTIWIIIHWFSKKWRCSNNSKFHETIWNIPRIAIHEIFMWFFLIWIFNSFIKLVMIYLKCGVRAWKKKIMKNYEFYRYKYANRVNNMQKSCILIKIFN